jgi:phage-related minor tail protein
MTINLNVKIDATGLQEGILSLQEQIATVMGALMDAKEILMSEMSQLRTEIAGLGSKLDERLTTLNNSVEELKAKVAEGVDSSELAEVVAEIDAATADVQGIANRLSGMGTPTEETPTEGEAPEEGEGDTEGEDAGGGVTEPV